MAEFKPGDRVVTSWGGMGNLTCKRFDGCLWRQDWYWQGDDGSDGYVNEKDIKLESRPMATMGDFIKEAVDKAVEERLAGYILKERPRYRSEKHSSGSFLIRGSGHHAPTIAKFYDEIELEKAVDLLNGK